MTKLAYTEAAARLSSMILDNREEEARTNRGQDPVHLAPVGYDRLAQGIIQQVEADGATFSGGKRELDVGDEMSQSMRESLPKRRDWIYNTGMAGSWRGGSRGRRGGYGAARGGPGPSRGRDSQGDRYN